MPAPYVIEEYVRWSDVDFAGIIFYGSYVRFFEIAETELFRAAGLPHREFFDRFDIWLPRKAVHAEFFRPARLDDRLRVATYVARLGTKSLRHERVQHEDVQDADRQAAPRRAVVSGQTVHGGRLGQPGQVPAAVGDGAESEGGL